jgi:hypothetical protein
MVTVILTKKAAQFLEGIICQSIHDFARVEKEVDEKAAQDALEFLVEVLSALKHGREGG